ncbi:hypothetical protein SDC9_45843 [bioreactor metagenome]|uniref:N-acetyltransferase domain-containing protein n=1 Tax=bioreactor metagenome TaxID=1076179 RepID=A0A644W773_9ZZZZ
MDELILELPEEKHEIKANGWKEEFFTHNEMVINGSALFDHMDFKDWLAFTRKNRNPETVTHGWVPATTFFAVRKSDGKIVGMVDVRHNLNNEFLREYGGHIGYSVCPGEREKGYAAQMLNLALAYARTIGLSRVMIGAYADNLGSVKTITSCGGKLFETKPYADGKPMNVYWIELS